MRVKISYTVDLDDIPNKVTKLLNEAQVKSSVFHESLKSAGRKVQNNNTSGAIGELEVLREAVFKIDNFLTDSLNILMGYQKALASELEEKETADESYEKP